MARKRNPVITTEGGGGGNNDILLIGAAVLGVAYLLGSNKTDPPIPPIPPGDTGTVSVTSIPTGAWVKIDAVDAGVTPISKKSLAVGSHTLQIGYTGYRTVADPFTVVKGLDTAVSYALVINDPDEIISLTTGVVLTSDTAVLLGNPVTLTIPITNSGNRSKNVSVIVKIKEGVNAFAGTLRQTLTTAEVAIAPAGQYSFQVTYIANGTLGTFRSAEITVCINNEMVPYAYVSVGNPFAENKFCLVNGRLLTLVINGYGTVQIGGTGYGGKVSDGIYAFYPNTWAELLFHPHSYVLDVTDASGTEILFDGLGGAVEMNRDRVITVTYPQYAPVLTYVKLWGNRYFPSGLPANPKYWRILHEKVNADGTLTEDFAALEGIDTRNYFYEQVMSLGRFGLQYADENGNWYSWYHPESGVTDYTLWTDVVAVNLSDNGEYWLSWAENNTAVLEFYQ
jgi:hypothetical protein